MTEMEGINEIRVTIPVEEKEQTSGMLAVPQDFRKFCRAGVILAHGAGNNMGHPLMLSLSRGLAEAGYLTLRFNFLYAERGGKAPDNQRTLILTWQSAFTYLKNGSGWDTEKVVAAGKSMGGRVASQMVAEGLLAADRLIFFGYPLHAAGKEDTLRDEHLYRIAIPMLFFAGTRDPLCNLTKLHPVLNRLSAPWELEIIEGGDHSLCPPKSSGSSAEAVYDQILTKVIHWLRREAP